MSNQAKKFKIQAKDISFDLRHRQTIKFNISKYDIAVANGSERYQNLSVGKDKIAYLKRKMLANWDNYLLDFEKNAKANGIEVLWAKDTQEAQSYIQQILQENEAKLLVKSKSMTTEEIELNQTAEAVGCESVVTDLGEFIVQLAGEKPYHIVTPAMHKSKKDIAELFNEKLNTPLESTPEEMTIYVRDILREKYTKADVGLTGANFLIADIGGVALTENEGNGLMSTSFPKIHIAIAGIEKIIPSMKDLGLFWPLLASHGTGQQITNYNTIFTGPKKESEVDGPQNMYVILLDNGRTNLYADKDCNEALACIRCGACLNACPVYKTIGGYVYDSTYSGPIGSVITPFFRGFKEFGHLSFASTLCGACADVCPVKIPLPSLLLQNRKKVVEKNIRPLSEKLMMKGFRLVSSRRIAYDIVPGSIKNFAFAPFNFILWGPKRKMPTFAGKSFSKQYIQHKNEKN
ncbi:MAG: LutB/LldF family L-lactate oxidation iron-sulfur protein [Vallitaleaceae bacterium]|jgi:L-lactate dehydrogenase complex protein LldF|nr:LutB/LldF family L-lactate oxidation iron-sulfur protein [Vallitaleaceae bacterium]